MQQQSLQITTTPQSSMTSTEPITGGGNGGHVTVIKLEAATTTTTAATNAPVSVETTAKVSFSFVNSGGGSFIVCQLNLLSKS